MYINKKNKSRHLNKLFNRWIHGALLYMKYIIIMKYKKY